MSRSFDGLGIDEPTILLASPVFADSPEEAEAQLLEPQEQVLQGLPGVEEIEGNANSGGSFINLTFSIGTDMKAALVDVIGRMKRIRPLPADADRPVIQIGGGGNDSNDSLSWFFVQLLPGTKGPIEDYRRFIEDVIKPRIESVPGVASVNVNAGPPDDVRITVDLAKAAAMGIGIQDIAARATDPVDVSGGQVEIGRRQYALRFTGRYKPEDLGELVLAWRDGRPVKLGDVATVELKPPEQQFFVYQNGNPAIGLQVLRAPGA